MPQVVVVVNTSVIEAVRDKGDLNVGIPAGRPGNNNPERRRNLLVDILGKEQLALRLEAAAPTPDLSLADLAHSPGFVRFLGTAFQRWRTECREDASYVLPGDSGAAPSDVGLVPFHLVKGERPRSSGWNAEFACYASDFETPIYESTAPTLAEDLGVIDTAVSQLVAGAHATYAVTAHPGHHAGPSYYSGFCYLNNACIACSLLERRGLRTALLDLDFHGGNGSLDISQGSGRWFRSINCAGAYPWVDMGDMGIELPPGVDWEAGYAAALERALKELPEDTEALVVSLGYDTLVTDPEAGKRAGMGLSLTVDDFGLMGQRLLLARIPLLVVQEGGYDLKELPAAALAFVRGLGAPSSVGPISSRL